MPDRDKVIKGLECLARKQEQMANPCSKCDYHDRPNFAFCVADVATDALALLKEQEEKPFRCDKCGYHMEDGWCGMHGRYVKETDYCSFGAWKGR